MTDGDSVTINNLRDSANGTFVTLDDYLPITENAGENRRVRLIGQNGKIAGAMYSPRLVREVLNTLGKQLVDDGRLDSVNLYSAGPTADFLELYTQEWQENGYDQQGNLLDPVKVKEGKGKEIDWVLKQTLFGYVLESECAGRQGRPCSLTWVLKNKGEKVRARLVVRESREPNLRMRNSNTSGEFESIGQSRDRTSRQTWTKYGAGSVRRVESTLLRCV